MACINTKETFIDPDGDIIDCSANWKVNLILSGSNFQDPISMVTLVISGACMVAFLIIFIWSMRIKSELVSKILQKVSLRTSVFLMLLYFIIDFGNRIVHEMRLTLNMSYVLVKIPLDKTGSAADWTLILFIINYLSPAVLHVAASSKRPFLWSMKMCTYLLIIIDFASTGYGLAWLVNNYVLNSHDESHLQGHIYFYLGSAFYGGYFILAIAFLGIVIRAMTKTSDHKLHIVLPILGAVFTARSALTFVYSLYFDSFDHDRTEALNLVYMLLYGPLSVTTFACVIMILSRFGKLDGDSWNAQTAGGFIASDSTSTYMQNSGYPEKDDKQPQVHVYEA